MDGWHESVAEAEITTDESVKRTETVGSIEQGSGHAVTHHWMWCSTNELIIGGMKVVPNLNWIFFKLTLFLLLNQQFQTMMHIVRFWQSDVFMYFQYWFSCVMDTNWSRYDNTSLSGVWTARLHVAVHASLWALCCCTVWGVYCFEFLLISRDAHKRKQTIWQC